MKKLFFLFFAGVLLAGCTKDRPSPVFPFVVKVVGDNNIPIQNARVTATAPIANARPKFEGATDINGEIRFEYDMEAVLQITAIKGSPPMFEGCAFIKLEEGTTVTQTVHMFKYDPQNPGCL